MTSQLVTEAELNYNGIAFPMYTEVTSISGRPVYDSAGRTVTHVVWTLNVKSVLTVDSNLADVDIGDEFVSIRSALTRPGGRLYYRDNGLRFSLASTIAAKLPSFPNPLCHNSRSSPASGL